MLATFQFLSTPSARRATHGLDGADRYRNISIHALREEGDRRQPGFFPGYFYFYPRPPRGGRLLWEHWKEFMGEFLSTPSARRATCAASNGTERRMDFYPRPPRGGRLERHESVYPDGKISIHALREEGDSTATSVQLLSRYFYPRPPRGGRQSRGTCHITDNGFLSTPSARRAT